MSRRVQRVEQQLRRELALIAMSGELRDPRLGGEVAWSVTDVRVSPDLSHARVFVDVLAGAQAQQVLEGLQSSAKVIRSTLAGRMQMRRTPELRFERDDTLERAGRIDQILAELQQERDANEPDAQPDEAGSLSHSIDGTGALSPGTSSSDEPER